MRDFNKVEAAAYANELKQLLQSQGWQRYEEKLRESLKAWNSKLRTAIPVGEGAATMARAQGAVIVLEQALEWPVNTLKTLNDFVEGKLDKPEEGILEGATQK